MEVEEDLEVGDTEEGLAVAMEGVSTVGVDIMAAEVSKSCSPS
jgi:hypothetical protein